jgi:hypothetical protein
LNTARGILIVVGLLTIAVNVFQFAAADRLMDEEINKEVNELRRQGFEIDQAKLAELRSSAIGKSLLRCLV